MSFAPLFDVDVEELTTPKAKKKKEQSARPKKQKAKDLERGCEHCPLNDVPGINKVMGRIKGRSILLVAQSPGPQENEAEKELVGPAGQWLWDELKRVGVSRNDVDIQNAIRCYPADAAEGSYSTYLKMRAPSKEEIHCCSVYTDEALQQSQAKQILVFGQVAAKALFGRSLPSQKVFYSEELKAKIYLLDHPSFFVRGYGVGPRIDQFRRTLDTFASDRFALDGDDGKTAAREMSDQFAYVRKQDYRLVLNEEQALKAERIIRKYALKKGERISFDIEDDDFGEEGRKVICTGFSPKPGLSFIFVFRHADQKSKDGTAVTAIASRILQNPKIKKTAQHGCTDVTKLKELVGITVEGYTHDSALSEYLRFSDVKQYGLVATTERRFPELSGYWFVVVPEMMQAAEATWLAENEDKKLPAVFRQGYDAQSKYIEKNKLYHLRHVSLETLRVYNGADCDVSKRIERSNRKHIPQALMSLYIDLSFILMQMEPNGPLFDYEQHEKLSLIYPYKEKILRKKLRRIAGDKNFKPGSPKQVFDVMYETLGLEYPFDDKPNTRKMTLLMLGREHEFPRLMLEWRSVSKVKSTYLDGYIRSAKAHFNRLRTKWWSTGARTGRLSSGGERNKKESTIINLQNIKRDPQMQNMCIADAKWRRVYRVIGKITRKFPELRGYWRACEAARASKQPKPKSSSQVKRQIALLGRKIERWVASKMPDLRTFLILDYGQVEVRVAAQMSGDENLKADCASSDIHTTVGVTMTGWDADKIKNDEATRTLTKNVHFGILFGISKKNLYKFVLSMSPVEMRDRITEEEVGEAYDRYFERYTGIRAFIESQRAFAKENKYVKTLFGMFQTLNVTDDSNEDDAEYIDPEEVNERSAYWGNQAINGPVQGTAHQLMICALVNLIRKPNKYRKLGIPPMEVHDALYFNVRVLDIVEAHSLAKYLLEKESLATVASDFPDIDWKVPIVVDAKAGLRLGTKVEVDEKTTIGQFMVDWYVRCREQDKALDKELQKVAA